MSSSVFVSGATGYIGNGVARAFRRAGYKVYGLLRNQAKANKLLKDEIIPVVASVDQVDEYKDILKQCSIIVDAVGYESGEAVNTFLNAAEEAGKERNKTQDGPKIDIYKPLYIYTSGIMTYGRARNTPVDETTRPKPFVESMTKREQFENKVLMTGKSSESNLRTIVVRPGFVFGTHGGNIFHKFADIDKNADLIIDGSPDKRWSWVHVDDLGDAYTLLARKPNLSNQLYNLALQNDSPRYQDLRVAIAKQVGWDESKNKIVYKKDCDVEPWEATVIINHFKAVDQLGWKPRREGFIENVELYYKSYLAARSK
ncbi:nsdhl [Acrasis kona]|uniref:Nsdhl n=1 Tax=Acrasis kona TaxID=1008807 RepID=A0AAW2YJJ0_9EUKA